MTQQHPITPSSKLAAEWVAEIYGDPAIPLHPITLQLVERAARWGADQALEAAANPVDELQAASAEARPDGLVEKVAYAIAGDFPVPYRWKPEARAAILAVADWLEQQGLHSFAKLLRQEAQ